MTGITPDVVAAIATRQPLRYAGYAYDAHSATYYLSARHYDPATMRFLTKDPARDDGEESAYQYCAGDPVGKVDPTGLRPRWVSTLAGWARGFGEWAYGVVWFTVPPVDAVHRFFWIRWAARFDLGYQRRAAQHYMDSTISTQNRSWIVDISTAFINAGIECGYDYSTKRWNKWGAQVRQDAIRQYSREFARRRLELVKEVARKA